MNGFILLARSILESEVFASQKMLKIWIWCLCKANHKDKFVSIKTGRGETTVKVKRSQFLFGRFKAEEELGIDGSTIYKHMQKLQDIGNIEIKSNSHYSIISICNYDTYQQAEEYKVTGNEQAKDKQVTGNEQASNTTKNDNNVKNVKNDKNNTGWNFLKDQLINLDSQNYEKIASAHKMSLEQVRQGMLDFLDKMERTEDIYRTKIQYLSHFDNWIKLQKKEDSMIEKRKRESEQYLKQQELIRLEFEKENKI